MMSGVRQGAVAVVVGCFKLAGCVETRDPNTIPIKQAQDEAMTCNDLGVEYRTNTSVATHKIAKNDEDDTKDVVLGLLIWPGLADFKNADGIEGNALLDRNIYLRELAMKKCEISEWPKQPERYD